MIVLDAAHSKLSRSVLDVSNGACDCGVSFAALASFNVAALVLQAVHIDCDMFSSSEPQNPIASPLICHLNALQYHGASVQELRHGVETCCPALTV